MFKWLMMTDLPMKRTVIFQFAKRWRTGEGTDLAWADLFIFPTEVHRPDRPGDRTTGWFFWGCEPGDMISFDSKRITCDFLNTKIELVYEPTMIWLQNNGTVHDHETWSKYVKMTAFLGTWTIFRHLNCCDRTDRPSGRSLLAQKTPTAYNVLVGLASSKMSTRE